MPYQDEPLAVPGRNAYSTSKKTEAVLSMKNYKLEVRIRLPWVIDKLIFFAVRNTLNYGTVQAMQI